MNLLNKLSVMNDRSREVVIIIVEGLSDEEVRDLYKEYAGHCSISFSKGSIGGFMAEIGANPFYSALAANIIAPLILKLSAKAWEKIKISIRTSDGDYFPNLNKENLSKAWEYIKGKYAKSEGK